MSEENSNPLEPGADAQNENAAESAATPAPEAATEPMPAPTGAPQMVTQPPAPSATATMPAAAPADPTAAAAVPPADPAAPAPTVPAAAPFPAPSDGKATAALVCGILSILLCGGFVVGIVLGIIAIVFATKYIKGGGLAGTAKIGRVCGIVGIVLSVIVAIAATVLLSLAMVGLGSMGDSSTTSFYSHSYDSKAHSESHSDDHSDDHAYDSATLDQQEAQAVAAVAGLLDKVKAGDPEIIQGIADVVEADLAEYDDMSLSSMGVDPVEYVKAMLVGFTYDADEAELFGSSGFYHTVDIEVVVKDAMDVYDILADKLERATPVASEEEALKACGQFLMEAINEAEIDDTSLSFFVDKVGDSYEVDMDDFYTEMANAII